MSNESTNPTPNTTLTAGQQRMLAQLRDAGGSREYDGRSLRTIVQLERLGLVGSERGSHLRGIRVHLVTVTAEDVTAYADSDPRAPHALDACAENLADMNVSEDDPTYNRQLLEMARGCVEAGDFDALLDAEPPSCARCGRPVGNLPNGLARPYNLSDTGDAVCTEPRGCKLAIIDGAKPLPRPSAEDAERAFVRNGDPFTALDAEPEGITPEDFETARLADAGHEGAREAVNDLHEAGDHRLCARVCNPGEFTRGHRDGSADSMAGGPRQDFVTDLPPNLPYAQGYAVGYENPTTVCPHHPTHDGFCFRYVEFCVGRQLDPCCVGSVARYSVYLRAGDDGQGAPR